MISLRNCIVKGCDGQLRTVQSGGFHLNTRLTRLKCNECDYVCCSVQFLAPIDIMKYAKVAQGRGKAVSVPRLRHPITVDLDPHLTPEIKVHPSPPDPWLA